MNRYRFILTVFVLLVCYAGWAKEIPSSFEHYTVANGLASRTVYNCLQDRNGFLWIGTDVGVTCFDGRRFTHFTLSDGLGDNEILDIHEDGSGRIWFLPFTGKLSYFLEGKIHTTRNDSPLAKIPDGYQYNSPVEDARGTLYFLLDNTNAILILKAGQSIARLNLQGLLKGGEHISTVYRNAEGNKVYGITTQNRVILVSSSLPQDLTPASMRNRHQTHQFVSNPKSKVPLSFNDKGIYGWYDTMPRLLIPAKQFYVQTLLSNAGGIILNMDEEENIWLTHAHNPTLFFKKQQGRYQAGVPILNNHTVVVSMDREKQLWFCTADDGLYKIAYDRFLRTVSVQTEYEGMPVLSVLAATDGSRWLGYGQGVLLRYDKEGATTYYLKGAGFNNRVVRIAEDRKQNIWCAMDEGIFKVARLQNGYAPFAKALRYENNELVTGTVKGFSTDTLGNLYPIIPWCSWNVKIAPGAQYAAAHPSLPGLKGRRMFSSYIDAHNQWYISTLRGTSYVQGDSLVTLSFAPYMNIPALFFAAKGNVVFMAASGNRVLAIENHKLVACLDEKNGLRGQACRQLYTHNDTLYVLTNAGITMAHYDIEQKRFTVTGYITQENGLLCNDVNDLAFEGDRMLVATSEGLSVLAGGDMGLKASPPKVSFTGFQVNDSVFALRQHISFSYQKQRVRISFVGPTTDQPKQLLYRYKLGDEQEWRETRSNEVEFSNPQHGEYVFCVQAKKYNSGWSHTSTLGFVITPPFYATWWFRIGMVLLGGALLYFLYGFELRRRVQKQLALLREQEALERERNRIAAELHDDIGSELTNIVLLSHMLKRENVPEGSREIVQKLEQSSDRVVHNMNGVIWTLNTPEDTLQNLAGFLRAEARKYLDQQSFHYKFDVEDNVYVSMPVSPVLRRQLFLVLKEVLHNIVKHACASKVLVRMQLAAGCLQLEVEDNGTGFDYSTPRKGNGLRNMQKRVTAINGTWMLQSEAGKGTRISISVPLDSQMA